MGVREVAILGGARTPMADYVGAPGGGKFKDISAIELGAVATRAVLERFRVSPGLVDEVIFGYGMQSSPDGGYGARHVSLFAGLPETVPALTVGRTCGSGFQSIISGAKDILLGESDFVVAGGMENMSQVPYVLRGAREGFRMGDRKVEDYLMTSLYDSYCNMNMAQTADKLAKMYRVTREESDQFAYESKMRASAAATPANTSTSIIANRGWATEFVTSCSIVRTSKTTRFGSRPLTIRRISGTTSSGSESVRTTSLMRSKR